MDGYRDIYMKVTSLVYRTIKAQTVYLEYETIVRCVRYSKNIG